MHTGCDDRAPIRGGEPKIATGDLKAGGQAFDVPLPRTGKGLIEVVDVEDHLALRGGEQAEVGQVRIPAQLHADPERGVWARSEAMISAAPR